MSVNNHLHAEGEIGILANQTYSGLGLILYGNVLDGNL